MKLNGKINTHEPPINFKMKTLPVSLNLLVNSSLFPSTAPQYVCVHIYVCIIIYIHTYLCVYVCG